MIEEARIEYGSGAGMNYNRKESRSEELKVIVDNVEILDITLGLYGNVFVRVKDIDGYEYAGELTEVMEDE
jgi:hypothetical protein